MRKLIALVAVTFATAAFADGAATFNSKCKMCHGADGAGSKMAPTPIAGLPAEQVKKAITDGKGKMKPVALDNADEVAAYVSGLNNTGLGGAQVPNLDAARAQAASTKADASATAATAKQDASVKADAAKNDATAKADATKHDATTQVKAAAQKANAKTKTTGKSCVAKGTKKTATKVKTAVGKEKGAVVETAAHGKANTAVDHATEKVDSKLK